MLGSSRGRFAGRFPPPLDFSSCSATPLFRLRPWECPLTEPLCHLQMSPFRMSWICWTIRFIATKDLKDKREATVLKSKANFIHAQLYCLIFTHVINSTRYYDICIFLGLSWREISDVMNALNNLTQLSNGCVCVFSPEGRTLQRPV